MKRYFYFVARFLKLGKIGYSNGIQETDEGFFDIMAAVKQVSEQEDIDLKKVVVTFWAETNSVMYGKFNTLKERLDD